MSTTLIPVRQEPSAIPGLVAARIDEFLRRSQAARTWRAYRADWEHFVGWCRAQNVVPIPVDPHAVAAYLAEYAETLKISTLQRGLAAISRVHHAAGLPSPASMADAVLRDTWRGIRRCKGVAQVAKAAILIDDLRRMMEFLPSDLLGVRALLLVGFAGAFRRSELVSLDVEDLEFRGEGLVVSLRRSKTDQEGEGRQVGIPYGSDPVTCPFRASRAWLNASALQNGALFRSVDRHGRVGGKRLSDKANVLGISFRVTTNGQFCSIVMKR